jgi:hypothetical protein
MRDPTTSDALPTPDQMRNYFAAARAAWQTRRLRESSRAVITGNIAFVACLISVVLVVMQSDWFDGAGPFVMCGLLFGYIACLIVSLRWMMRQRSRSSVMVIDRREAEVKQAKGHPRQVAVIFFAFVVFQTLAIALWKVAFQHMSNSAILAALAIGPALATGFFVYRFVVFRFWEDLLFAVAVVMAYTPFFLQDWRLTPLSFASLAAVVVGTVCLHRRWVHWARSLPREDTEEATAEEVRL